MCHFCQKWNIDPIRHHLTLLISDQLHDLTILHSLAIHLPQGDLAHQQLHSEKKGGQNNLDVYTLLQTIENYSLS